MNLYQRLTFLAMLLFSAYGYGQQTQPPFAAEIRAFAQKDSLQPTAPGALLFVGSSSLRLWSALQQDFPRHRVLNRGFGGASIPDVIRYAGETIYRYQPGQIIFYCGENDLASSDTIQPATVVRRFTDLFNQIRRQQPGVPFVFISIKPSPSRAHLKPKVMETNRQIRDFLATQPHTRYVDVYTPMLQADGRPRGELFGPDSLHMNRQGYVLWKEKLEPALKATE